MEYGWVLEGERISVVQSYDTEHTQIANLLPFVIQRAFLIPG